MIGLRFRSLNSSQISGASCFLHRLRNRPLAAPSATCSPPPSAAVFSCARPLSSQSPRGLLTASALSNPNRADHYRHRGMSVAAAASGAEVTVGALPAWTWQQTMLRIKDPKKSLPFYQDVLGMTLVDKYDFPQFSFSLYFLQSLPQGQDYTLEPGSDEAHKYLWSIPGVALELTHNWGTEDKEGAVYHPGNADKDGFGHLAFACEDVYKCCDELEAAGVEFKKKPDEGRMKGLAFVYDPDGYWMEIIGRAASPDAPKYAFAQTMLRVKDPKKSIEFYTGTLGMTVVRESHFSDFSLFFLATLPLGTVVPDPTGEEAREWVRNELYPKCVPILELTHNHGTESDPEFVYFSGNEDPRKGFGHIGFLVDDVYEECAKLEANGVSFQKKPDEGGMKGLAFAKDPDGYW
eukprot:CAMPEP_0196571384 /NCGR_PEP_ID=MMETSP1081-20130531/1571_1 /TAXON_ID=36882 /ORGANISM="Pyramimonas amylifera, Strain CCMP720" /LENGTH=405 /DNA_ID=CAMNT_0041888313 /DNA_START=71 /DNA_END=1285 /DNA_ORIENTATION=-